MKNTKLLLLLILYGMSTALNAQVIGHTDDVSIPGKVNFQITTGLNARLNAISCEDNCTGPDDDSYACGYTFGCNFGYESGYDDANSCDFGATSGVIGTFKGEFFENGYYDAFPIAYQQGYDDRILEKRQTCESGNISQITFAFDDFLCDCRCVEKEFWYDGDGDGYYERDEFPIRECSAPSPKWKLASELLGTDCNDKDPEVWFYNQCGLCIANISGITTWYYDNDGDGYYGQSQTGCNKPVTGEESKWFANPLAGQDCDDQDFEANIEKNWYYFNDADNYYGIEVVSCVRPDSGLKEKWKTSPGNGTDCDDDNSDVIGETFWYYDFDGDGFFSNTSFGCQPPDEGEREKWSTSDGTGEIDCDDEDPLRYNKDVCGICGGDGNPEKVYWDFDQDGYHSFEMGEFCGGYDVGKRVAISIDYLVSLGFPSEAFNPLPDSNYATPRLLEDVITFSGSGRSLQNFETTEETNRIPFNTPYDYWFVPRHRHDVVYQFFYPRPFTHIIMVVQKEVPVIFGTKGTLGEDCDDLNPAVWASGDWYFDRDKDGYHDADAFPVSNTCQPPDEGYVLLVNSKGIDCDDTDQYANEPKTWYFFGDADNYYGRDTTSCENPGKFNGLADSWRTDQGNGPDCNDTDQDATIVKMWYKDADGDRYYSDRISSCVNPGATNGQRTYWKTDPGFGEDCDDAAPDKQTVNACGVCGGSEEPVDVYLDMDGDGYHSLYKKEDCGLSLFRGDLVRSATTFPETLLPDSISYQFDQLIAITGTDYQLTYSVDSSGVESFYFPEELLKYYSLGLDCDDLDPLTKADGAWYPDRDEDGYHDANAPPVNACTPPTHIRYVLLENSRGPDCDDNDSLYSEVKTWYRDQDGDGYYVEVMESCHDPGFGWALTASRGPDDNDDNPFSPTGLAGEESFIMPGLIDEVVSDNGDTLIVYGNTRYHPDSLKIQYRGATFTFYDLIFDLVNPDTLLSKQKLVLAENDVLYGAAITGTPYVDPVVAAREVLTEIASDPLEINVGVRSETHWIRQTKQQNTGYTHAYGDQWVHPGQNSESSKYFKEAFDQEAFEQIKAHYDLNGHPPFTIEYKSYKEKRRISLDGLTVEPDYEPILDEAIGSGPKAARIEVMESVTGRIEYIVSFNDEVFQATGEELASQTWLGDDGQPEEKVDIAGRWLSVEDEQSYRGQLEKTKMTRVKMVESLVQNFQLFANAPTSDSGDSGLPTELFPDYNFDDFGFWFKLTELIEIGHHVGHEFEMPEGMWNPAHPTSAKWKTKSAASIAGIIAQSGKEVEEHADMIEIAQSLVKQETSEQVLASLKGFNISEMLEGFITEDRANAVVMQGGEGVYKQYHAIGKEMAKVGFVIREEWQKIPKYGEKISKGQISPDYKLGKRFRDFKSNFNFESQRITTSIQFNKLDETLQYKLTRHLAEDPTNQLRNVLAFKPELIDAWQVLFQDVDDETLEVTKYAPVEELVNLQAEFLSYELDNESCKDRAKERFNELIFTRKFFLAPSAAVTEYFLCETEEDKWDGHEDEFYIGFLNATLQELDAVSLLETAEALKSFIDQANETRRDCFVQSLKETIIGSLPKSTEELRKDLMLCTFGVDVDREDIEAFKQVIIEYVDQISDDPYEQGQFTQMLVSLLMPSNKASLFAKLKPTILARAKLLRNYRKTGNVLEDIAEKPNMSIDELRDILRRNIVRANLSDDAIDLTEDVRIALGKLEQKTGADFIDLVIHSDGDKFLLDNGTSLNIDELAQILSGLPTNKPIRLLSCSSLESAKELAMRLKVEIYANDGLTRIHSDGKISAVSRTDGSAVEWQHIGKDGEVINGAGKHDPAAVSDDFIELGTLKFLPENLGVEAFEDFLILSRTNNTSEVLWGTRKGYEDILKDGPYGSTDLSNLLNAENKDVVFGFFNSKNEIGHKPEVPELSDFARDKGLIFEQFGANGLSSVDEDALPKNLILQAMIRSRANGGQIHFRLDLFVELLDNSFEPMLKGSALSTFDGFTRFELRNIVRNKDWFENTMFYRNEKILTTEELNELGIKFITQ